MSTEDDPWFAVRCVVDTGSGAVGAARTYEERITLWRAATAELAIERAEAEACEYAVAITGSPAGYLGFAQSYRFDGPPGVGVEVFSLVRDSDLPPSEYLERFFSTGGERQGAVDGAPD